MKRFYLLVAFLIISCEDNNTSTINQELTFISSEGNFGSSNASISVYKGEEEIQKIEDIGDVLQSILVHGNKLFAILNNSHLIKVYSISEEGLALPGIDVPTNTSSPREMVVVGNYLYFTNWNSQDVKYLNLTTYKIEGSIKVDGMPEGIISDQTNLFVAINMNSDYSSASTVVKINISSRQVTNEYKVGKGPHALALEGDNLWVTNRYYDDSYLTYIGTSKIDLTTGTVTIKDYGRGGSACAGDLFNFNKALYRTFDGGVSPLNTDASILTSGKIGNYNDNKLYSSHANSEHIFIGLSDYVAPDTVLVHDKNGAYVYSLVTGASPGDYANWRPE